MLEAVAASDIRQVSLWVDGELIAQLDAPPFQGWWLLEHGLHQAWATALTTDGDQITSEIVLFSVEIGE
jgi:hypothetical protein